jgi:hypothetical protein
MSKVTLLAALCVGLSMVAVGCNSGGAVPAATPVAARPVAPAAIAFEPSKMISGQTIVWKMQAMHCDSVGKLALDHDIVLVCSKGQSAVVFRHSDGIPYAIATTGYAAWVDPGDSDSVICAPFAAVYFEFAVTEEGEVHVTFGARDRANLPSIKIEVPVLQARSSGWMRDQLGGGVMREGVESNVFIDNDESPWGVRRVVVSGGGGVVVSLADMTALRARRAEVKADLPPWSRDSKYVRMIGSPDDWSSKPSMPRGGVAVGGGAGPGYDTIKRMVDYAIVP